MIRGPGSACKLSQNVVPPALGPFLCAYAQDVLLARICRHVLVVREGGNTIKALNCRYSIVPFRPQTLNPKPSL